MIGFIVKVPELDSCARTQSKPLSAHCQASRPHRTVRARLVRLSLAASPASKFTESADPPRESASTVCCLCFSLALF
eukprot:759537-Hanusia_phi.AAC.3